jgi:hypothetical protein
MTTRSRNSLRGPQLLESRLAPAAVTIVNPTTATFTDVDGDAVTVRVSRGNLTAGVFTLRAEGSGHQLERITLSGGGFDHANLTLQASRGPDGDGLVNVGHVDSIGHDLGKVSVTGDLGRIDAGDGDPSAPAVKALAVRSLGRLKTDTQSAGGILKSVLVGRVESISVGEDMVGATLYVNGGADDVNGTIGSINIHGSVIGQSGPSSGVVSASGAIGVVRVGGSIMGGSGASSGQITGKGGIGRVAIGGSVIGGAGAWSGRIDSYKDLGVVRVAHDVRGGAGDYSGLIEWWNNLTSVTVGGSVVGGDGSGSGLVSGYMDTGFNIAGLVRVAHDVRGGSGDRAGSILLSGQLARVEIGGALIGGPGYGSGNVESDSDLGYVSIAHDILGSSGTYSGAVFGTSLKRLAIGGSLLGGTNTDAGEVRIAGDIGEIRIGHDLVGGSISGTTPTLERTGYVVSSTRIGSVFVGGSVVVGVDTSSGGSLTGNASIRAGESIGRVVIRGDLAGNPGTPAYLTAGGPTGIAPVGSPPTIGTIVVGGRVEYARIQAGYSPELVPTSADATIGTVSVGGDWVASSMIAGCVSGPDNKFGTADDARMSGAGVMDNANVVSAIGRVTIGGLAFGTPDSVSTTDHYGIVSQHIGQVIIYGRPLWLTAGPANDRGVKAILVTNDLTVMEVAL